MYFDNKPPFGAVPDQPEQTPENGATLGARVWAKAFLSILSETGNVTKAAKAAQIDRATAYRYKQDDPSFAASWQDAIDSFADALESEAYRRAVEGVEEPVYQRANKWERSGGILTLSCWQC